MKDERSCPPTGREIQRLFNELNTLPEQWSPHWRPLLLSSKAKMGRHGMNLRTRILIDTRDLIADKLLWTQGIMKSNDDPPKRCLSGAIRRAVAEATGIPEHQVVDNRIAWDVIALVKWCISSRPDAKAKCLKFKIKPPKNEKWLVDEKWLVAFNDLSRHDEVISIIDEAIAQSEPCCECLAELTPQTWHSLRINDTDKVLCNQCSNYYR